MRQVLLKPGEKNSSANELMTVRLIKRATINAKAVSRYI
jgi:hypothetical protein